MADSLGYSPHEPMDWGAEDERALDPERELIASRSGEIAESYSVEDGVLGAVAQSEKINRMISMALAGALPRGRPLKPWEPDKLNARHISAIMLRAVGYQQNRIAELTGYSVPAVSVILNHPDSKALLAAILSEGAKQAIDISGQVKRDAPKMLKIVKEIADDLEVKPETRVRAAFGWLGMYERTLDREKGTDDTAKVSMHRDDADRLINAMKEAAQIRGATYVVVDEQVDSGSSASPVASASGPSYLPEGAIDPVLMQQAERQWALEQALEARIAAAEPNEPQQGLADGSELAAVPIDPRAEVSRSNPKGLHLASRDDGSTESTVSTPKSAVGVQTERQVSTRNVEKSA